MIKISLSRSLDLFFLASISLQFISGIYGDSSGPKVGTNAETHANSRSHRGSEVILILLAVLAIGLFSFFLFKLWQKKKREEQYARLLKLFEEDDELEVELGLRD